MGQNTVNQYGAKGRVDLLMYDPEDITLVKDKKHGLYDPRVELPVDKALVQNILKHGIIEPIGIRKNGSDKIECVFGRRRVLAAIEVNKILTEAGKAKIRVPSRIVHGDDKHVLSFTISENELRREDPPILKAKKIQRYIDMGYSVEEAAVTFGVTGQTIRNYTSMLDCHPTVLKAVTEGKIAAALAATQISKIPREKQVEALNKLIASGTTKGLAAERNVRRLRNGKETAKPRVLKIRRRNEIARVIKVLGGLDRADSEAMVAALKWVLGNENAFGKKFGAVETAIYPKEEAAN